MLGFIAVFCSKDGNDGFQNMYMEISYPTFNVGLPLVQWLGLFAMEGVRCLFLIHFNFLLGPF